MNTNTSDKITRVGTREDVYKGIAQRTAGNLKKDDIIEKIYGNRNIYISKKLSDKMKANIQILRTHNPNFLKRKPKQTMISHLEGSVQPSDHATSVQSNNIDNIKPNHKSILKKQPGTSSIGKTQKLSFKVNNNDVRTVYYPELKGINLQELKAELIQEEAEEDKGISLIPNKVKSSETTFLIEENMPDFDINEL